MNNLDLNKLEQKLDDSLSNETSESLTNWLEEKRMTNNKAREYTSPLIEELLNEVTPEEMERTNREMENMDKKCKTKNIQVILESLDPTGVSTKKNEFTMEVIDDTECMRVERLYLHVGDCLYRIDNKGFIIDRVIPHE
jgi:C-terminal processing protease CtpA/Prc